MFKYKALNKEGDYVEGEINLPSEAHVKSELLKLQFVPIKIVALNDSPSKKKFLPVRRKKFDQQQFFENLFDYLDSGLSIDKALELEAHGYQKADGDEFLIDLVDQVRQGVPLSEVMQIYPEKFSSLYIGVVHVGEETDSLTDSFKLLSSLTHDIQEFKQKIKSALIYPIILSTVMLISILVLFGLVIPRFKSLFVGMGIEMNGLTGAVVAISDVLTNYYQVMLAIVLLLIFTFKLLKKSAFSSSKWERNLLKFPLLGVMIQQYNLYIIAKIMHILIKKKITVDKSLRHLRDALDNIVYKNEIEAMITKISRGESIQSALNSVLFTQHFIYIIGVGEETGRLSDSFSKLASYYYKQLDVRIKTLMTYAEPAIIMLLGLVVGLIVVSMLQAILSINELAA